ncbi:MAG TPA: MBL fold metallo-hydrolase [Chloroflexota bacterium]|nr:MBL fold metallo-hydrolase [Chloroflexota bacterium]
MLFQRLSPHLYRFPDTCNVYAVLDPTDPTRCVLIDFGDGACLDRLGEIGVSRVDWILHTHHHRDQAQGDHRAVARGIPLAVPAHERRLFDDVESFWKQRRIAHLYYVRNTYLTLTESVPVARELRDYETLDWGAYAFQVLPSPGHTLGSITLLAQIDGRRVAFSGDLIFGPGQTVTLYDLQYQYGAMDGVDCALVAVDHLRQRAPDLLCPSHGEPMGPAQTADGALELLGRRLREWYEFYTFGNATTLDATFLEVLPGVIECTSSTSQFYALIAPDGSALFVDYGSASGSFFSSFNAGLDGSDRMRFVEHSLPELRARYGLRRIDVAMPSHMHDDHLNGFPYLQRQHGTRVWAYENMKDVLEHPEGYLLGCTNAEPIKVDRTLGDGEAVGWGGLDLTVVHSPGHTEYQMALLGRLGGRRIAFTGDNYFKAVLPDGAMRIRHNVIYANHVEGDSFLRSVDKLLAFEPEFIAPGHGPAFEVQRVDLERYRDRMQAQTAHWEAILPTGDDGAPSGAGDGTPAELAPAGGAAPPVGLGYGLDPRWVSLYPYQMRVDSRGEVALEVRLRNYGRGPLRASVTLRLPRTWDCDPARLDLTAPPGGTARGPFRLRVPPGFSWPASRVAIAADVTADGRHLGQIAEGVVDLHPAAPA